MMETSSHLSEAVELGDVSKVIQLLTDGVDVNSPSGLNGETPLIEAALHGNVDILTLLLSCPCINVNAQDLSGQTALLVASCHGHASFVSALLQCPDTDPNIADWRGASPLLASLMAGQHQVAQILLASASVQWNTSSHDGHTPLLVGNRIQWVMPFQMRFSLADNLTKLRSIKCKNYTEELNCKKQCLQFITFYPSSTKYFVSWSEGIL